MKEETKAAFERAIAQSDAQEDAELQRRQKQADAQRDFETEYWKVMQGVIVPSLDEITRMLQQSAWICRTTTSSTGVVRFDVYKGTMSAVGGVEGTPHVTFAPEPDLQKLRIGWASQSQAVGGQDYLLSQITGEFVQQQVLTMFQKLAAEPIR